MKLSAFRKVSHQPKSTSAARFHILDDDASGWQHNLAQSWKMDADRADLRIITYHRNIARGESHKFASDRICAWILGPDGNALASGKP